MTSGKTIEELRKSVRDSKGDGTRAENLLVLLRHSDAVWDDALECLPYPVVGEYIAFHLHRVLEVEIPPDGPIRKREAWEAVLKDRNIDVRTSLSSCGLSLLG